MKRLEESKEETEGVEREMEGEAKRERRLIMRRGADVRASYLTLRDLLLREVVRDLLTEVSRGSNEYIATGACSLFVNDPATGWPLVRCK
jgi:hypothetical protein